MMKKKLTAFALIPLLLCALALPAAADVIWEPEDSFYSRHRDDCTYVGRSYELAGYDGSVNLWSAPNGTVKASYSNGSSCTVQFRYSALGGTDWGYVYSVGENNAEGWIPMDDLTLVYDSASFIEEHEEEFFTDTVIVDYHEAYVYSYPHGRLWNTLEEDAEYMPFSDLFSDNTLYTDSDGLRWCSVYYYMGRLNGWICIDDPMNGSLDDGIVPVSPSPAQLRGSSTVTAGPLNNPLLLAAVAIAVLIVATLLLIRKFHPRKKDNGPAAGNV